MNERAIQLLKLDYDKTLAFIDKADSMLLRIKSWAITTNAGVLALALYTQRPALLWANLFLIGSFWMLDLFYKCFHEDAIQHSSQIEKILGRAEIQGNLVLDGYVFGIGHAIRLPDRNKIVNTIILKRFHHWFIYPVLIVATLLAMAFLMLSPP